MNDWFDAEKHIEKAHQWLEAGLLEDALRELKCAIQVNPFQGEWHYYMGMVLSSMKRHQDAFDSFRKAIACQLDDDELYFQAGISAYKAGLMQQAVKYLSLAEKIDSQNEEVYSYRIAAYTQLHHFEQAELMFYLALHLDEVSAKTWWFMGNCMLQQNRGQKAVDCFEQVDQLDPFFEGLPGKKGIALLQIGDVEEAQKCFRRQLRENPMDIGTINEFGKLMLALDRMPEAESKFNRVIENEPQNVDAHYYIGIIAMRHHLLDRAQMAFETVLKVEPHYPLVNQKLAAIMIKQGKLEEATRYLKKELSLFSNKHEVRAQEELATLLLKANMPNEGAEVYSRMIKRRPNDSRLMHEKVLALFAANRYEEAVRLGRCAIEINPNAKDTLASLVHAHLELGQLQRSQYWLRQLVNRAPSYHGIWRLRWRVYADAAKAMLRKITG